MSQRFGLSTATAEPPFPRKPVDAWGSRPSHFPFEVRHGGPSAPPAIPKDFQNPRSGVSPPAALLWSQSSGRSPTQLILWLVIVKSEQAPRAPPGDVQ